jgi:tetratricopeptide (TPR) repeat protein
MQNFIKKYGDDLYKINMQEDYKFFNGAEYNDFIREKSAVSMAAFGDGCMNLSYQTRNNAMLARIDSAIAENDAAFADLMYHGAITPILHGMDMDYNPEIIPAQNIAQSAPIMAEWQAAAPNSALLQFNLAWIAFLEKDYERAISLLVPIAERLDETPPSMHDFVKPFYWRNLYFCYDMAHKHDSAAAFNQCRIVCNSLGFNNDYAKTICRR